MMSVGMECGAGRGRGSWLGPGRNLLGKTFTGNVSEVGVELAELPS